MLIIFSSAGFSKISAVAEITVSFVLAFALSFPVAYAFVSLFKRFYAITFIANPINLGIFLKILIIPLILSIGWTYLIAMKIIKKDAILLINNVENNKPNILVRAFSHVTPIRQPFVISYATKGLLRSSGKSLLLFMSVFISSFLIAFSMSSTTMIEKQVQGALKNLNIKDYGLNNIENFYL